MTSAHFSGTPKPAVAEAPDPAVAEAPDPAVAEAPWLIIIDPQVIFAHPSSDWASPQFDDAMTEIERIAPRFGDRILVTRWLPTAPRMVEPRGKAPGRPTSWDHYFQAWSFADKPADATLFDLVPRARALTLRPTIDVSTFGKWCDSLRAVTGDAPHLVLTGVSTDCCVIATALAAADAGAHIQVVEEACAGSTPSDGEAALQVMRLFAPQIRVRPAREFA